MAVIHGVAGEWARVRGAVRGLRSLFVSIFVLGYTAAIMAHVSLQWGALAFVLSLCAVVYLLARGERRMENYYKGARGEEHISNLLSSLPDGYHVFHDFVAGAEHIDHVVLGPGGILAIETKFWNGKVSLAEGHILLNGQLPDRDPVAQTCREAALVRSWLTRHGWKGDVGAFLVFASNTFEMSRAESHGAMVVNADNLLESITTRREILSASEVSRLAQLMETNV